MTQTDSSGSQEDSAENWAIETKSLTRNFGDKIAVNSVDIQVERGTLYGFLGHNGAGKSTTIKMLTGLLAPSGGDMRVLGFDMNNEQQSLQAKKRIGVIPENLALFENLTAQEYLTFVGRIHGLSLETIRERSAELLSLMTLDTEPKTLALEYSHGMRKKLSLAAALLPNPELLFLDEPFEGVDAVASVTIREILTNFVNRGSTVFITSHVLEIVQKLCTHVGIIMQGKLVHQSSMQQILDHGSLEQYFLSLAGNENTATNRLNWLES
jgi:ABC-2 type transport system ATP-binding protein